MSESNMSDGKIKEDTKYKNKKLSDSTPKLFSFFILFLGAAGFILSIISLHSYVGAQTFGESYHTFCNMNASFNCNKVNLSKFSLFLSLPLSSWGILFYFFLLLLGGSTFLTDRLVTARNCFVTGLIATFFSIYLFLVSKFIIKAFCIVCIYLYIINIFVFIAGYLLGFHYSFKRLIGSFFRSLISFPRLLIGTLHQLDDEQKKAKLLSQYVFVSALMFFGVIIGTLQLPGVFERSIRSSFPEAEIKKTRDLQLRYEKWRDSPQRVIPFSTSTDSYIGNPDAKVKIVEFSDFECPACRRVAVPLKAYIDIHKEDLLFVFKHFPLDKACNQSLQRDMHLNACFSAALAECTGRLTSSFFEVSEKIFKHEVFERSESKDEVRRVLISDIYNQFITPKGVSKNNFVSCLESEPVTQKIRDDISLGNELQLEGTPSLWVNNRKIDYFDEELLNKIISQNR
jgi:protein-disulfide isomerase/uncharacterized membrane protein